MIKVPGDTFAELDLRVWNETHEGTAYIYVSYTGQTYRVPAWKMEGGMTITMQHHPLKSLRLDIEISAPDWEQVPGGVGEAT